MTRLLAGTIGAVLALFPAAADAAGPFDTGHAGWEAVGRLDFAGRAWCTGALVAEDLVLTAAHCLYDRTTGRRYAVSEMSFHAGPGDRYLASARGVTRAEIDPAFDYGGADPVARVAHDLALLRLDAPIEGTEIAPFDTAARPRTGTELGVVTYADGLPGAVRLTPACAVMARQGGLLVLDCAAHPGSSGSPVFAMDGAAPRIVSVISSMASVGTREVSLGTALTWPLADLRTAMETPEAPPGAANSGPAILAQAYAAALPGTAPAQTGPGPAGLSDQTVGD